MELRNEVKDFHGSNFSINSGGGSTGKRLTDQELPFENNSTAESARRRGGCGSTGEQHNARQQSYFISHQPRGGNDAATQRRRFFGRAKYGDGGIKGTTTMLFEFFLGHSSPLSTAVVAGKVESILSSMEQFLCVTSARNETVAIIDELT